MKTMVSALGLSILLLSAGAFANNGLVSAPNKVSVNVTVVHKNGTEPVLPPAIASCAANRCVEI